MIEKPNELLTIGERIKRQRIRKGMTQQQLADNLGLSQGTVAGWERGSSKPNVRVIQRLAETFGTSTEYFYREWDDVIGIPPEHKHNAELDNWLCEHCGEEGDIEKSLLLLFNSLNSEGQRRVLELSYDLMQIRRYQSNYFSAMREAKEANGDAPQDNP